MRLSMLLEVFCLLIFLSHQQIIAEVIICNHNFTRYLLDDTGDSRGTAGSVWHINNGEWEPVDYDPSMNRNTLCGSSIDSTIKLHSTVWC